MHYDFIYVKCKFSSAVSMFVSQAVRERAIPFHVAIRKPIGMLLRGLGNKRTKIHGCRIIYGMNKAVQLCGRRGIELGRSSRVVPIALLLFAISS